MNKKLVLNVIGKLLIVEGVLMLPSLIVALVLNEGDADAFFYSISILFLLGILLIIFSRPNALELRIREGYVIVGLAWVLFAAFGALPFLFSGTIHNYWDAFFESASGFTTTGATILADVESLPRGILFWRSFTHWVGGMGVLVFTLALLPKISSRTTVLARAESPGPTFSKLMPKMGETARALYIIYAAMTLMEILALLMAGMPLYDSLIHAMGTAGTGGFSNKNLSVGAYNNTAVDITITLFMFLFGVNFSVYYHLLFNGGRNALKNEELRMYVSLAVVSIVLIALCLIPTYGNFFTALRYSGFQVGSIMSTTGFTTSNFDLWPQFTRALLLVLMIFGACAGSTAGGVKIVRVLIQFKNSFREVCHTLQPRKIKVITLDKKSVQEDVIAQIGVFFFAYIMLLFLGVLVVSLNGVDFITSFSSVVACLSNVGPGLSLVGPMGNYAIFSDATKAFLSFLMLAGRLELFPLLILFHPVVWKGK